MRVRFWGTRGSIPAPGKDTTVYGGNTTCLEITLDTGRKVIVDAGTGIRALGEHLSSSSEKVDIHLLVTHIHWDHVLGFPFFSPLYDPDTKIWVDGFPNCMKGLRYLFDNKVGDGFFPVEFDALKAMVTHLDILGHGPLKIDAAHVDKVSLYHPQGGFGFRFREHKKTLVFITDNELKGDAPSGRRPDDYVRFCKDADVLIHDAQYTPEEVGEHRGWGHSDCLSACKLAHEAQVKRLILFHHDPSRKDPEISRIEERCRAFTRKKSSAMTVTAAKEGSVLDV